MRKTCFVGSSWARCAAVAITSGLLIHSLQAAEEKPAAAGGAPDMEQMMKKMEALAAPGPEHHLLASMAGEWDAEARCFMGGRRHPQP